MSIATKLGLKPSLEKIKDASIAETIKCRERKNKNTRLQTEKLAIQKGLIAAIEREKSSAEARAASADRLPPPQAQMLLEEQLVAVSREVTSIGKSLIDSESLLAEAEKAERIAVDTWALDYFIGGLTDIAAVFNESMLAKLGGLIKHAESFQRSGLPYDLPGNLILLRNLIDGIVTSLPQYLGQSKEQPINKSDAFGMRVKFVKSTDSRVVGMPAYSVGEIASFKPEVARQLVKKGYAERLGAVSREESDAAS